MSIFDELRRLPEARTVDGLTARLAVAEALIEELHQALATEVRERYPRTAMSDQDIWDYIEEEYGIGRVQEVPHGR